MNTEESIARRQFTGEPLSLNSAGGLHAKSQEQRPWCQLRPTAEGRDRGGRSPKATHSYVYVGEDTIFPNAKVAAVPVFRCTGSVSLTPDASQVRTWGTFTDISLRGCYIEMISTLPVDTKVELVLDASGIRIRAKGIVRISYPGPGMGILLTDLAPEQRQFLDQLLAIATLVQAPPAAFPTTGSREALRTWSPQSIRSHFSMN